MWKYVAFVALIIFCVPGALSTSANSSSSSTTPEVDTSEVGSGSLSANDSSSSTTPGVNTSAVETSSQSTVVASTTETTTNASETTTNASETTTNASDTTTKVPVTTTSAPTTTTVLPPPAVGKYALHDDAKNETCLRMDMALRVDVSNLHVLYNFPTNASMKGSNCNASDNRQILKLTDEQEGHSLTFIFVQENEKNYVQNISFDYSSALEVETSGHYFSASKGKSYLCNAETSVKMDNVTLTFSSIHVQAFGESFGLAEECEADDKVGDIVPIAVGCALGALVIIVLIAYLVGRRRSRQRGYQSV